jgi:hypothetical protein
MDGDSIIRAEDAKSRDESPTIQEIRDGQDLDRIPEPEMNKSMAESQSTKRGYGINVLPNELLDHILRYLDGPAPSASERLYEEPILELTGSEARDLKTCSLVCRTWRDVVLPRLFRHACLSVSEANLNISSPISAAQPSAFFSSFIQRKNLKTSVASFTIRITNADTPETATEDARGCEHGIDFSNFWARVFEAVDPLTVTIVATPPLLGALTGCDVNMEDEWGFVMAYHILQLSYRSLPKPKPIPQTEVQGQNPDPSTADRAAPLALPAYQSSAPTLFSIRPWTTLLLNEGSFIRAYSTPTFFSLRPPSILPSLVGINPHSIGTSPYSGVPVMSSCPPKLPPAITSLSYIAVFPTSSHTSLLTTHLPHLTHLFTQFVPRASHPFFADASFSTSSRKPAEHYELDVNDCWMERNSSYALIMRELLAVPPAGNWATLRAFESGDAADTDAWNMAVEYMRRAGGGWNVERPGVFVKNELRHGNEQAGLGEGGGGEGDGFGTEALPSLLLVDE